MTRVGVHYTYVLFSERDGKLYTGVTSDLRARLKLHTTGRVSSTAQRRPLKLLYYEACLSADDAYRRERYLKSGRGGRYLRTRLSSSLAEIGNKLERHSRNRVTRSAAIEEDGVDDESP